MLGELFEFATSYYPYVFAAFGLSCICGLYTLVVSVLCCPPQTREVQVPREVVKQVFVAVPTTCSRCAAMTGQAPTPTMMIPSTVLPNSLLSACSDQTLCKRGPSLPAKGGSGL